MLKKNKKGISAVIAITLLLIITVLAIVAFQTWYNEYQSKTFTKTEQEGSAEMLITGINDLIGDSLYFVNSQTENLTITEIEIVQNNASNPSEKVKKPCGITRSIGHGIHEITLNTGCLNVTGQEKVEILVHTDKKLYSKHKYATSTDSSSTESETVELGGSCTSITPEGFAGGDGSSSTPWQICSCGQLQNISNYLNANFTITQNINCSETSTWNAGAGFLPISLYTGIFDGGNFTIDQLYINRGETDYIGLFGQVASAAIVQNIGLTNVNITGNDQVGGVVGRNNQGIVNSTHINGNIQGDSYVGGLVGYNYGSVDNSYSTAVVSANIWSAGGLVGKNYHGLIDNSYNTGEVNAPGYLAGLVGYDYYGSIDNSYNTANINSTGGNIGGIVGSGSNSVISRTYNTGNISSDGSWAGGLVGSFPNSVVNHSYSTGNVEGTNYVGGIGGKMVNDNIYNVSNSGNIVGANYVGGLVGDVTGTLSKAYNTGVVTGEIRVGGAIGWAENIDVSNVYSTGNVTGDDDVGGFIGYIRLLSSTINNTYATGDVIGNNTVGGFIGDMSNVEVLNSYSTGSVTGTTEVGGFIGHNTGATVDVNSRWNNHTGNPDLGIAVDDNAQTVTAIADNEAYFYNSSNLPMSEWPAIWSFEESSYPTFS